MNHDHSDHSHDLHHSHDHMHDSQDHHSHDHTHPHHHNPTDPAALDTPPFEVKLIKLLDHWVHHNEDHANNYRDWAAKAQAAGFEDVAKILSSAADLTDKMSRQFTEAKESIHAH
jgi:hypothetical protein